MYIISINDLKSINGVKFHITISKSSYSNPSSMYLIKKNKSSIIKKKKYVHLFPFKNLSIQVVYSKYWN